MMKCINEDCQYFKEHKKCSEECTKRGIKKIVTNADKIRNMSDEELSKFFSEKCKIGIEFAICWLQSEADF